MIIWECDLPHSPKTPPYCNVEVSYLSNLHLLMGTSSSPSVFSLGTISFPPSSCSKQKHLLLPLSRGL